MKAQPKTIAYIDGANLYKGITSLGWKLDKRDILRVQNEKAPGRDAPLQGSSSW